MKKSIANKFAKKDTWDYQKCINYYENNYAHLPGAEIF